MSERPDVEHYVRCSVVVGDVVVEPGLELRAADDFDSLCEALEIIAADIGGRVVPGCDRYKLCEQSRADFELLWPGRAWFVEVSDAAERRWTQSYQPFGIPRSR